jgi:predicted nucleic acid-binding protein
MALKIFIDANVLLDFVLQRQKYEVARTVIGLVENGDLQAFISPAIIHIIAYWLTKTYGRKKSRELLLLLLTNIKVIDANHDVAFNAIYSKIDDVEDALQYFTAVHHKLDYFLTNDKDFKKNGTKNLPILTPEEFLARLSF